MDVSLYSITKFEHRKRFIVGSLTDDINQLRKFIVQLFFLCSRVDKTYRKGDQVDLYLRLSGYILLNLIAPVF